VRFSSVALKTTTEGHMRGCSLRSRTRDTETPHMPRRATSFQRGEEHIGTFPVLLEVKKQTPDLSLYACV
jgi:hypothetical protein